LTADGRAGAAGYGAPRRGLKNNFILCGTHSSGSAIPLRDAAGSAPAGPPFARARTGPHPALARRASGLASHPARARVVRALELAQRRRSVQGHGRSLAPAPAPGPRLDHAAPAPARFGQWPAQSPAGGSGVRPDPAPGRATRASPYDPVKTQN